MVALPQGWSRAQNASPDLVSRVEWQESRGDPNAVSPKGAFGPMQLMPDTARDPGFGVQPLNLAAPDQAAENRRLGTDYLNAMLKRYNGDEEAALVAYNWGPGNADKWVAGGRDRNALPRETQGYVRNIMGGTDAPLGAVGQTKALALPEGWSRQKPPAPEPAGDFTLENQMPLPERGVPVTAGGLANAAASGVQEGMVGMLGLPGDVRQYAAKAIEGMTGAELPEMPNWVPAQIGGLPTGARTSSELQAGLEGAGLPSYDPQNVPEEYAKTLGAFAPAAATGGGGVARRVAQTVVPAALSETGGQVGRQISPAAEQALRVAGGIYGGLKTSGSKIPKGPASTDEVKALAQQNYDLADNAGVALKGESFFNFVRSLQTDKVIKGLRLDPKLHPKLSAAVEDMTGIISGPPRQDAMQALTGATKKWTPGTMDLQTFDNLRRNMLAAARSADPDERRVAGHIIDRLDTWFENLSRNDVAAGDYRTASTAMRNARDLWRKFRKSEEIDTIIEVAKERSGQFTLSGPANALKTGFRQLATKIAKDPRTANRFTEEEKSLIRRLSRGGKLENMLFMLSKLSPRGALALTAGGANYLYGDPQYTGAAFVAGEAARLGGGLLAKRRAGQLGQLVRSGGQRTGGVPGVAPAAGIAASSPYRVENQ